MSTINLHKFDPNVLVNRTGSTSVVIGAPATGKTFLVEQDLLPRIQHTAHTGIHSNEEPTRIYRVNDPITLGTLVDFIRKITPFRSEPVSIVVEDLNTIAQNNDIKYLFMNGRFHKINLFLNILFPDLPLNLRKNTDFVFLFYTSSLHIQQKLYRQYGGMFPTFEMFQQIFVEATRRRGGCLVIDQTSRSSILRLEDRVFWYSSIKSRPVARAVDIIERNWLRILAKRRLMRLKIAKEIEHLPNIGVKYFEAMNNFNQIRHHP